MKKIRILLTDDHGVVRQGLRSLIERHDDMEVVAEAENGRKAIELAGELMPDIVIMDISMPGLNGVGATSQIVSALPQTKVIALSMHSERQFVANMLKAGASGYILKECLFDDLFQAVTIVAGGGTYLSPKITEIVVGDYVERLASDQKPQETMSEREKEVLQLLAEGKTTKQMAAGLHVSFKTIEANRRQIMEKLNLYSVADLTRYAIKQGLTLL